MSDAIPDPIPRDLSEAFHSAVAAYESWKPSMPEPEVSLDMKPISISTLFGSVTKFGDPMPEYLQHRLASLPGAGDLGDLSYGSGARYLLELMGDRKDTYEHVQKITQR